MYLPRSFRVQDRQQLREFISRYSFCTLLTANGTEVAVSHLPLVPDFSGDPWVLRGHFARANDHWTLLGGARSTAVFNGPHSYISPGWYVETAEVPTWNYASVHAICSARLIEDTGELGQLVDEMIACFETQYGSPWDRKLDVGYRRQQLTHIVGFELKIEQLHGKFKLGQNRSAADQRKMHASLKESGKADSMELASFMDTLQSAKRSNK